MSAILISCMVCVFTAGVVDEDYRGNVGVVLFNFSKDTFEGELWHQYMILSSDNYNNKILLLSKNIQAPRGKSWCKSERMLSPVLSSSLKLVCANRSKHSLRFIFAPSAFYVVMFFRQMTNAAQNVDKYSTATAEALTWCRLSCNLCQDSLSLSLRIVVYDCGRISEAVVQI